MFFSLPKTFMYIQTLILLRVKSIRMVQEPKYGLHRNAFDITHQKRGSRLLIRKREVGL